MRRRGWRSIRKRRPRARLINAIIDDTSTDSDNARLGRIDDRIENVNSDLRRYLGEENKRLLPLLEAGNFAEVRASLARADTLRDEFNQRVEEIRTRHAGAGPRRRRGDDAGPAKGHRHLG